MIDAERTSSFDGAVKLTCNDLSCGWSLVWHNINEWFPKEFTCEKCGGSVFIKPARKVDICRLGTDRRRYAIPESQQTHYYKDGILRKKDIF